MAQWLGRPKVVSDSAFFENYDEQIRLDALKVFPENPVVNDAEWAAIVAYFVDKAPETLPRSRRDSLRPLDTFLVRENQSPVLATVASVRYDPHGQQIWASQRSGDIIMLDAQLRKVDSLAAFNSPFSDFRARKDGKYNLLNMGYMDPNDESNGALMSVRKAGGTWRGRRVVGGLQRPVQATYADVNEDGREDVIVCEYGNYTGKLAWYAATEADSMTQHIIENRPGARTTYWEDYDGDGRKDLWVLFAQGDEQIAVYLNGGNGNFAKKILLRFPPVHGSSSFELADFNGDGRLDILYANGDNGDKSYVFKPYHGIRIFINKGTDTFEETYFFPFDGAMQALARDFDQDGDLDIAAIAFFPDFALDPVRSFVYLENTGNNRFTSRTFPDANRGRWLTMSAADIDRDGDVDLLLGSFYFALTPTPETMLERWKKENKGVVLLENKLKQ